MKRILQALGLLSITAMVMLAAASANPKRLQKKKQPAAKTGTTDSTIVYGHRVTGLFFFTNKKKHNH